MVPAFKFQIMARRDWERSGCSRPKFLEISLPLRGKARLKNVFIYITFLKGQIGRLCDHRLLRSRNNYSWGVIAATALYFAEVVLILEGRNHVSSWAMDSTHVCVCVARFSDLWALVGLWGLNMRAKLLIISKSQICTSYRLLWWTEGKKPFKFSTWKFYNKLKIMPSFGQDEHWDWKSTSCSKGRRRITVVFHSWPVV